MFPSFLRTPKRSAVVAVSVLVGLLANMTLVTAASPDFDIRSGQWVEGPGYKVVWDMGPRTLCEAACRADPRCAMFEYWKPRQKCNLYDHTRIKGPSAQSDVGLRITGKP